MKRLLNRLFILTLASAVIFTMSACSSTSSNEESSSEQSSSAEAQSEVLRIGMECAYAPNNWQEDVETESNLPIENLPGFYAEGYDIQMAKLIAAQMDVEIVVVKMSWEGLIEALNQGQIDMIIAGMADTAERKESINFSETYSPTETEYCIMVRSDGQYAEATSLADFEGASILGQKGTLYDTVIDQIPNVDHVAAVDGTSNMISRLQQGTVDGLVFDTDTADAYLGSSSDFAIVYFEKGQGFDIGFTGACVGIRKSDTELVERINAALATIPVETRKQLMSDAKNNMPQ